jgi:hypothetical protein
MHILRMPNVVDEKKLKRMLSYQIRQTELRRNILGWE